MGPQQPRNFAAPRALAMLDGLQKIGFPLTEVVIDGDARDAFAGGSALQFGEPMRHPERLPKERVRIVEIEIVNYVNEQKGGAWLCRLRLARASFSRATHHHSTPVRFTAVCSSVDCCQIGQSQDAEKPSNFIVCRTLGSLKGSSCAFSVWHPDCC
jgi:hypothetical protein